MHLSETEKINEQLALACQATCSSCCKKGKIFLPNGEYEKILEWITENSPDDVAEFQARSEKYDGFHLYDQKSRCQFLDVKDLCRLHTWGVKPRECFWWPLHIYTTESNNLDIRVSTSCCSAYQHIGPLSPYVDAVQAEVEDLGAALIRRFRVAYPGSYSGNSLREIKVQ